MVRGRSYPFELIVERRGSWRIALGRQAIRMRIPHHDMSGRLGGNPKLWACQWLEKQYDRNPQLFERYHRSAPISGQVYQTIFGSLVLQINPTRGQKGKGSITSDGVINITLPEEWSAEVIKKHMPKFVSRVMAASLRPAFVRWVQATNERHYGFDYSRISLKYNHSNWGSCSAKKNLNFSTRLFLVPKDVADYVIIHELAHLKILNHSRQFWRLVEDACPDYRKHVKWLREDGAHLDF